MLHVTQNHLRARAAFRVSWFADAQGVTLRDPEGEAVCPSPPGNDEEAEGDGQHLDADSLKV